MKKHQVLGDAEQRPPYKYAVTGVLSVGVVVDVDESSGTLSLRFTHQIEGPLGTRPIQSEYPAVPVFYHCQKSNTVFGGVYAFSPGDQAMVIHSPYRDGGIVPPLPVAGEPYTPCTYTFPAKSPVAGAVLDQPVVIGFADGNLRKCKAPLIAGGMICSPSFEDSAKIGRSLVYRSTSGFEASTVALHDVPAQFSFFQIKYEPTAVSYQKTKVAQGVESLETVTVDVSIGIAIARGYRDLDSTLNTVVLTAHRENGFRIDRELITILQPPVSNYSSFHANISENLSTVFVVYGDIVQKHLRDYTNPGGGFTYMVLKRRAEKETGRVYWEQTDSGYHRVPQFNTHLFVDQAGVVYGFTDHKGDSGAVGDDDSAFKVDIHTGAVSSTGKYTVGYTIIDGKFEGIFQKVFTEEPIQEPMEWTSNHPYACNEYTQVTHYIDDGYQMSDSSDEPCQYPDYCSASNCPSECVKTRAINRRWKYWKYLNRIYEYDDQKRQVVSWGEGGSTAVTGTRLETDMYSESSPVQRATSLCDGYACPENEYKCHEISTTIVYDNHQEMRRTTELIRAVLGTVTESVMGRIETWGASANEPCTGPCVCISFSISDVTDCGCTQAIPGVHLYSTFQWYKTFSHCSSPALTNNVVDWQNVLFPFKKDNAYGVSSFVAYDRNQGGHKIIGMKYHDKADSTTKWHIEMDGVNVTKELFDALENPMACNGLAGSCPALSSDQFDYLGFLF